VRNDVSHGFGGLRDRFYFGNGDRNGLGGLGHGLHGLSRRRGRRVGRRWSGERAARVDNQGGARRQQTDQPDDYRAERYARAPGPSPASVYGTGVVAIET
jgi:hypothetical protein